jgi:peroxiredoxin-like protein
MMSLPHTYSVAVRADPDGPTQVSGAGLPTLITAPPEQFGGPGDRWSPETLFVAAVADCFALTFRAVAQANELDWQSLACDASGKLDKADGKLGFSSIEINARLELLRHDDERKARRLLQKAEENCLISNSINCPVVLTTEVGS